MITHIAVSMILELPIDALAWTFTTKVHAEGIGLQEAKEGEEFSNTVLEGSSGQTKLVLRLERKDGSSGAARTILLQLERIDCEFGLWVWDTLILCASSRTTRCHWTACRTLFSLTIPSLRLKPLFCLRKTDSREPSRRVSKVIRYTVLDE